MLLLAADHRVSLTVEAAAEMAIGERSAGTGAGVDGVFGVRALFVPASFHYLGFSADARAGTLGSKNAVGSVQLISTDIRMDLLAHGRFPIHVQALTVIPALVIGLDASVQVQQLQVVDTVARRVAFIPGFSYGLRVALEGHMGWSVGVMALLVSTDARLPQAFIGVTAGYVFRL